MQFSLKTYFMEHHSVNSIHALFIMLIGGGVTDLKKKFTATPQLSVIQEIGFQTGWVSIYGNPGN